ncbi:hypothetical protein [Candidatus Nitronereus thalassa]|uniref:DUF4129 domain-containing protein n=1 Tax=Candidatus Nitronereus thalassa TaxID=3020898 RepID=A0ABU3K8X1_9BACT|nr:hypothetical protein [Candidatus Nitronereus thalassa]MDT7042840.1 hypothetical protein [Candidatus Nitronereus thalassa]
MHNLKELLGHPLIILLVGTVLSSILIPSWFRESDEAKLRREARLGLAVEVTKHSSEGTQLLNRVVTTLELFCRDEPDARAIPRTEADLLALRQRLAEEYAEFNLRAWYWYWEVLVRANGLSMTEESQQQLMSLFEHHKTLVSEFGVVLGKVWKRCTSLGPIPDPLPKEERVDYLRAAFNEFESSQAKPIADAILILSP